MNETQSSLIITYYKWFGLCIIICLEFIILLMYGIFTSYNITNYTTILEYVLTNLLAVMGFGLLLVYFRFSVMQNFVVSIVVGFINVQLGPLMQQFWYDAFIKGFDKAGPPLDSFGYYKLIYDSGT